MDRIRLGIIGLGNMGCGHLHSILQGDSPRVCVTALCDTDAEKFRHAHEMCPDAAAFESADALIGSGTADAVLIAVPHYSHPEIAVSAFRNGLHVLTEKPAGVYTRQVREMNAAAQSSGRVFGIMFNQRTNPVYAKAREIVQSGALGELKRMVWIITNWYRTQAYYDSGSWRATWNGEGGGVLLNQAPHNLDLWQWIFGMPQKLRAFCAFGKYHHITVEDDVTIYGEYENGASASFITTTGDACGTNRLEITGDRGKLVLEDGRLRHWTLKTPEREFCFMSREGFACPETEYVEFTAPEPDGHPIILNNFADAVLDGTPLIAPGYEGLNSLSISNAAYLSAWTNDWASLPIDETQFEQYVAERCAEETQIRHPAAVCESAERLAERWRVHW